MTSVGYGDITPAADSAPQQFFAWGVMFVGTAMYAILFAVMTTYISNLDAMGDHFRTDVQQTIAWANYRELPDELRSRILRYFSYKWRKCRRRSDMATSRRTSGPGARMSRTTLRLSSRWW